MSDRQSPAAPAASAMTSEEQQRREHFQAAQQAIRVETNGMAMAFTALQPLSREARLRAMRWLDAVLTNQGPFEEEPPF